MIVQSLLALATVLPALTMAAPHVKAREVNLGFPYGSETVRGVNLGGWLVLEPFITPSLFDNTGNEGIVDEYTFGQYQDHGSTFPTLKKHWDTWITEGDFAQMASAGLNHVRIPIGFWAYDVSGGEPYIQGQAEYLDRAIGWARNHGLKVLIDVHGAPGSQNGYDNSGRRGDAQWHTDPKNVERTKNIVQQLSEKYSDPQYYGVVTSIAILNEPATYLSQELFNVNKQFNYDAYGAARYPFQGRSDKSGLAVVIHDGFQPSSTFGNDFTGSQYEDVILDHHQYTVFSNAEVAYDDQKRLNTICGTAGNLNSSPLWIIVGEWSLATTDCALYLNGRGRGSRYDGSFTGSPQVGSCQGKTGDGSNFSEEYKYYLRKFWDTQTQVYENNGRGWVYWTWKTENAAEWSYSAGLQGGWIPWNPTQHLAGLDTLCT